MLLFQLGILAYRMNTPNIFNTTVHIVTLALEAILPSLTLIGLIALATQKDILTTLAYTFLIVPMLVRIAFTLEERRKH